VVDAGGCWLVAMVAGCGLSANDGVVGVSRGAALPLNMGGRFCRC
jgi:hypothetical protein